MTRLKTLGPKSWSHFLCCGLFWGGNWESRFGFEILGVVLYLRDCNNNHTSTTGLVASIILSTVDQKCMGVKTILVWVCVDVSVHFVNSKTNQGWGQSSNVLWWRVRLPLSSSRRAPPLSGNTPLPPPCECELHLDISQRTLVYTD